MIKLENTVLPSPEQWRTVVMGARNPMNSWDRSDSRFDEELDFDPTDYPNFFMMGCNDYTLLKKLSASGTDHRKFMRMIPVYVDITAPLYWWKEFDTYKVGTVANSCSTMHKITSKRFAMADFSTEHLLPRSYKSLGYTVKTLNEWRDIYLVYDKYLSGEVEVSEEIANIIKNNTKKDIWWQLIQLLPSSYNQKRTVLLNYEVLANIYKSRKDHKQDEWREGFCKWIESLPYAEFMIGE